MDSDRERLVMSDHLHRSASADVPDVAVVPARLEERRIILLGRPGGGKSSSGNNILGSDRFRPVQGFNPGTTKSESKSAEVEGRQVTVVDTPGLTEKVLAPKQLYKEIMNTIVEANPGPHAFVIVVKLDRVSEADIKLFEILPKLFGPYASKYSMVLFTHGEGVGDDAIDQMIKSNQQVSDLVSMCGGRYCLFDNNQRGTERNRQQVRRFLGKVDQMVSENREHYTKEMFFKAQNVKMKFSLKWDEFVEMIWDEISEWFISLLRAIETSLLRSISYFGQ